MRIERLNYTTMTDEQLVLAMANGERVAFDQLYQRYAKSLQAYFYRMMWKDQEKAADFVHDLFTKLIHRPQLFDVSRSFKTWVFSVANNMCKNEYKKQAIRSGNQSTDTPGFIAVDAQKLTDERAHLQLFQSAFEEEIKQLDEKHKEVFELRHFEGLSMKEIAEVLELHEGTVKSRLFYATKHLALALKEYKPSFIQE